MTQDKTLCEFVQRDIAIGQALKPSQLAHIEHCQQCAVTLSNFQKLDRAFYQATANLVPDNFLERLMKQIPRAGVSETYFPFSDEILALFSRHRLLRTITISLGIALGIGQLVQFILGIFFVSMMAAM